MALDAPAINAVVAMGVSGCGKTTIGKALAQRLGWRFADGDSFHPAANIAKMSAGAPLTDDDRRPWLEAIAREIDRAAQAGERIVVACSALKRRYRDVLVHGRRDVRIVNLKGDKALIAARMAARKDHFMPPGLLDSQFAALEEPAADEDVVTVSVAAAVDRIVAQALTALGLG